LSPRANQINAQKYKKNKKVPIRQKYEMYEKRGVGGRGGGVAKRTDKNTDINGSSNLITNAYAKK
jgi:hypothetical protein